MSSLVRLSMLACVCALLASCQTNKSSSNDPYVSNFGNDGAYHPYAGQPGTMQSGGSHPTTPTYTAPPTTTAAQNDPYAFSGPTTASSQAASTSSHSGTKSKAKPKTTVSSSSGTTSKPKTSATAATTHSSSVSDESPKPKTAAKSGKKKSSSPGTYKVVQGDTLWGIAHKRGSTVAKIKNANNLTSDIIRPGMVFKIP